PFRVGVQRTAGSSRPASGEEAADHPQGVEDRPPAQRRTTGSVAPAPAWRETGPADAQSLIVAVTQNAALGRRFRFIIDSARVSDGVAAIILALAVSLHPAVPRPRLASRPAWP